MAVGNGELGMGNWELGKNTTPNVGYQIHEKLGLDPIGI